MPLAAGTRLGRYEILAPLGAGGMGEVYRARDAGLGREVAVKVLPDAVADDPAALLRFEKEAKAVAALSHPGILSLFDAGEASGVRFAVTELLEGETLREALKRGRLALKRALQIAAALADALAAAHDAWIVHRDVKPENVFLTRDGRTKLLDFGLARSDGGKLGPADTLSPTAPAMTAPGAIVGTVTYMSPEQAQGRPVDFRSDQFSLGVVLYEMLAGERPFRGASVPEVLTAIIRDEPVSLAAAAPAVPAPVRWIVDRCLAKDPEGRYGSTRDLARDLSAWTLHGAEVSAVLRAGPGGKAPEGGSRAVGLRRAAATGALVAAVALGGGIWLGHTRARGAAALPSPVPKLVRLTWETGAETNPSPSPDGESFAYVAGRQGAKDIFVRRVGGENPVNLTSGFPGDDEQPAFSPDGRSIAFRSERDGGGIFVMGATGESPRRVTEGGFVPAWSPDGKEIAYATFFGWGDGGWRSEIWIVDVASGARRKVYDGGGVRPTWSPSGRRIAFHQPQGEGAMAGRCSVSTIPVSGGAPTAAVALTGGLPATPSWSASGIVYLDEAGDVHNVFRVKVDEETGQPTGPPELVVASPGTRFPRSTPDGRKLLFEWQSSRYEIDRYPFDPVRGVLGGSPTPVRSDPREWRLVSVSPDGEWLAMLLFASGGRKEILLVSARTGEARRLTDDLLEKDSFVWAADGARLFFFQASEGTKEVWSIRPDGSGRQREVRSPEGVVPDLASPDGRTLFVAVGTDHRIHAVDLSAPPEARRLEPLPPLPSGQPCWTVDRSSDGGLLACIPPAAPAGGARPLFLLDLRTKVFSELELSLPWPTRRAFWLPGSRRILLDRGKRLELLDLSTRRVSDAGALPDETWDVALSADGRSLFTMKRSGEADIWMLDAAPR